MKTLRLRNQMAVVPKGVDAGMLGAKKNTPAGRKRCRGTYGASGPCTRVQWTSVLCFVTITA